MPNTISHTIVKFWRFLSAYANKMNSSIEFILMLHNMSLCETKIVAIVSRLNMANLIKHAESKASNYVHVCVAIVALTKEYCFLPSFRFYQIPLDSATIATIHDKQKLEE